MQYAAHISFYCFGRSRVLRDASVQLRWLMARSAYWPCSVSFQRWCSACV